MMAKRGAGGESVVIKVNIPISKASSPLSFPLMLVRKRWQLILVGHTPCMIDHSECKILLMPRYPSVNEVTIQLLHIPATPLLEPFPADQACHFLLIRPAICINQA